NHEIADLTGRAVEEVQGVTAFQNVHPDDRTTVLTVFRDLFANGSTVNVRSRNRHVDGRWVTVEVRARPLHRTDGDPRAVLVARDVTENVILENALRSAKAEAERANRAKSEFLSRMSHELRTPLNSVLGFTQVLQREEHLAEQEESLDYIYRAGLHLLDLINEVLDISRIESGAMSVSLESVAIEDLTHDCLALVAPQAQANAVRLVHRRDGNHYVRTDQQRATQVILNLLSNAIKYNRRDGSVTVTYEERSEWLRLSVTDTGNGIRPEDFTSLFEPFERLEAEFGNVEGTGLGLALSKGLVEAMGGELGMTSTLGEGSTFWVEFPIVTAPILDLDDTQTPMAVQGGGTGSSTLLYVEDNFANLKLVERLLRHRHDVRLLSATKGTLGLELAQQHLPQLILLDIHLPDVSGHDLLKRLRADPRTATIPVVIVSADATAGQLRRLMSAGAQDYLTKPLKVSAFFDVVNRFLKHQDPEHERRTDE
ncbi:MAG: response regulator, partial [Acidobacteriota bacterium]|nr:response regulator [Acidobacteriota bacterium]